MLGQLKESKLDIERDRETTQSDPEINILCFNLSEYSTLVQFLCCCATVFIFYLAYGYFLELIFTTEGVKPISLYITLVQFIFTLSFSYIESMIRKSKGRQVPLKVYSILAALTLGTMAFSNLSLSYLNYPTQLIFKSCKLIPVMIGSILIQGKKYAFLDYSAAIVMCIGLTMFTLADSQTSPNFDMFGILIISLALLCDAIIGNVQEKVMKQFRASNNEVVFYSYAIASVYLLVFVTFTGTLSRGFQFSLQYPMKLYGNIFLLSLSGYTGLQAVLTLVRICGAPITVTVTTMRKALSMLFSFVLFSKPFVFQYFWSGMLVVLAIYLNLYSKKHPNYTPDIVSRTMESIRGCFWFLPGKYRPLKPKSKFYTTV